MSALARLLPGLLMLLWQAPGFAVAPQASQAWIRVLPGDLPLAGYFVLENRGAQTLTLSGARSPAFRQIEIHQSLEESGVARMRMLERVDIPPGERLVFAPGGYHLMLFGRTQTLRPGENVTITLEFGDGSRLAVPFALRGATGR